MKLWTYYRSTCSWRVRIALAYKELDYEASPVHLTRDGGQQHEVAFRQRNPMAQVPLLEVDEAPGSPLAQSMAILEYLEERYPRPPLLPADPLARARARQLAELVNSGIQPLQNLSVRVYVRDVLGGNERAWAQHFISRGLAALEALAADTAGRFLVGDAVSLADLCLVPQLAAARRQEVELGPFPRLTTIEAECAKLPAFIKAHADAQPDAPPRKV